jgi:hypothetical protein
MHFAQTFLPQQEQSKIARNILEVLTNLQKTH